MDRKQYQCEILLVLGFLVCSSTSRAQVTATARVTLTVKAAPGIILIPIVTIKNSLLTNQSNGVGMIMTSATSNVAVILYASEDKRFLDIDPVGQGVTKTMTSKELKDISKVEVIYLGN